MVWLVSLVLPGSQEAGSGEDIGGGLGKTPCEEGGVRLLNWLVLRPRLAWGLGRAHGLQAARAPGCRQYFFKNLVFIVVKYTEHKIFHLNNFKYTAQRL